MFMMRYFNVLLQSIALPLLVKWGPAILWGYRVACVHRVPPPKKVSHCQIINNNRISS